MPAKNHKKGNLRAVYPTAAVAGEMPAAFNRALRDEYDDSKMFWASSQVTALSRGYWNIFKDTVEEAVQQSEKNSLELVESSLNQSKDKFAATLNQNALKVFDDWKNLYVQLLIQYDGGGSVEYDEKNLPTPPLNINFRKVSVMVGKTFIVKRNCPVCEKETRIVKTRSRINVLERDEDGCIHYENFNPYYYTIWVCEHCGYAADETTFEAKMPERYLKILRPALEAEDTKLPFNEERTLGDAETAFLLALKYLDLIKGKSSKRAKYAHQLAWIFRDSGNKTQETEYLNMAADYYEDALATEHFPIGILTDNAVIYLLAAIYNILGEKQKTTIYLSQLINDKELRNSDPRIYDKARDLWGEIRAAKKKQLTNRK